MTEYQEPAKEKKDKLTRVRERATLEKIGGRDVSLKGFKHDYLEQHLDNHLFRKEADQWCGPDCLAKVMFGQNTAAHRKGIRGRLSRAFRVMLARRRVMVVEFAPRSGKHHGEAIGFKFFTEGDTGAARQAMRSRLAKMQRHLNISQADIDTVLLITQIDSGADGQDN